jgi:hypothetical protein
MHFTICINVCTFVCNFKSTSYPIVLTFFHHEIGANQGTKQSWDSKNHNRWMCFSLQVQHLLHWKERETL